MMATDQGSTLEDLLDVKERYKDIIKFTLEKLESREVLDACALENTRVNVNRWIGEVDQAQEELIRLLPRDSLAAHTYDLVEFRERVKRSFEVLATEVYENTFPPPSHLQDTTQPLQNAFFFVQADSQMPQL